MDIKAPIDKQTVIIFAKLEMMCVYQKLSTLASIQIL